MTEKLTDDPVILSYHTPHVAVVTLNRPDVRNAVDLAMSARMRDIVSMTEADPDIRVVVLTGAGDKAFCAGADLKELSAGRYDALLESDGGFAGLTEAKRQKPWIAAINGPALAGGFEIALACDLMIASDTASFGLPEVSRGLIAASGGLWRLARVVPRQVAAEMILSARPMSAERAFALGMLSGLHEPEALFSEALRLAEDIAAGAPLAVQGSLSILRQASEQDTAALRQANRSARDRILFTEDAQEGARAFTEKRPPNWQGR